jgi:hypothetical protein
MFAPETCLSVEGIGGIVDESLSAPLGQLGIINAYF